MTRGVGTVRALCSLDALERSGGAAGPFSAGRLHGQRRLALPQIEVLSTRADLVAGGQALTAIDLPARARHVTVWLNGRNVTRLFAHGPTDATRAWSRTSSWGAIS